MNLTGSTWVLREDGEQNVTLRFMPRGVLEKRLSGTRATSGHRWMMRGSQLDLSFSDRPAAYVGSVEGTLIRGEILDGPDSGKSWIATLLVPAPSFRA